MPNADCDVVCEWLALIKEGGDGRTFWYNTPAPLVQRLARHARTHIGPPRPVEAGVFALDGGLLVGVMVCAGHARLVSPQRVLRDRLSEGWVRLSAGPVLYILGPDARFEGLAEQATREIDRAATLLELTVPAFRYYVPGPREFAAFARIEARMGHRAALAGWGWTDPHGGDVVSRNPVDTHELTHAVANTLSGWPGPVLREGLAECFTSPVDWRDWQTHREPCAPVDVWTGGPGAPRGWYSAAALLVTVLRQHLGLPGLKALWSDLADDADYGTMLDRCGCTDAQLSASYRDLWEIARSERYLARPSGLAAHWCG